MKLFERTPGYYIFYISAAYLTIGLYSVYNGIDGTFLSPIYVLFLALPFILPPLGRSMNLDVTWDQKMFNWFDKTFRRREYLQDDRSDSEKVADDMNKVIPFPELKSTPAPAPEPEKPAKIFYRMGVTDNNRVAFSMGYSEITMTKLGVQNMIDQLTVFRDQLHDEVDE